MSEFEILRTKEKWGLWPVWKVALQVGDDDNASRLWIVEKTMRIGSTKVKFGGIAGVGTKQEHRMKGYASVVLDASTELMQERGYDMGMLYGIRNFYHRFGYGVVFPVPRLFVKTENLLCAESVLKVRAMIKTDGAAVLKLYNRLNTTRNATVVRPTKWSYFELSPGFKKPGKAVVAEDSRGRIQGYATWCARDEQFLVSEIGCTGAVAFAALAKALGQRAKRAGVDQVIFDLPADDPFIDLCVPYGCERRIVYPNNSDAMGRIIHLRPLMEKLVPEFSKRVTDAGYVGQDVLNIETDIGSVGLGVHRGRVRVTDGDKSNVKIPQLILTQLVMGYRDIDDVMGETGVRSPKKALPLLRVLFPKRDGYMWWSDRF
ncbi:MAG: putative acetyltransferase [Candidatus Latescibacterota bacterium]|jgi:predicted acetyltransferase